MRKRLYSMICIFGLGGMLLLSAACGPAHTANAREPDEEKKKDAPVPVVAAQPLRADMEMTIELTATAVSEKQVPVYSETTGIVEGDPLEEGTAVRRGQVLAQLKRRELELALQQAQSSLDKAEADLRRSEDLFQQSLISQDDYDQLRYALDQARIARDQAELNLDKATIRAPIDGVIAERLLRRGDLVKPQQQLFTLVNLDDLKAYLHVPEKSIRLVKKGAPVRVRSDAYPQDAFDGLVERLSPVADPATGTFRVTVGIDNANHLIRPGMFLSANIVVDVHEQALVVPKKSLEYDTGGTVVYVVEKDRARVREVKLGYTDLMNVEILEGVGPEDRVITVGQHGLKPGSRVSIQENGSEA